MKKYFKESTEPIIIIILVFIGFCSLRITSSDLTWHNFSLKYLFDKHGKSIELLGESILLLIVVICLVLKDNKKLRERVKKLEDTLDTKHLEG